MACAGSRRSSRPAPQRRSIRARPRPSCVTAWSHPTQHETRHPPETASWEAGELVSNSLSTEQVVPLPAAKSTPASFAETMHRHNTQLRDHPTISSSSLALAAAVGLWEARHPWSVPSASSWHHPGLARDISNSLPILPAFKDVSGCGTTCG